jgi:hypothetical protein
MFDSIIYRILDKIVSGVKDINNIELINRQSLIKDKNYG